MDAPIKSLGVFKISLLACEISMSGIGSLLGEISLTWTNFPIDFGTVHHQLRVLRGWDEISSMLAISLLLDTISYSWA